MDWMSFGKGVIVGLTPSFLGLILLSWWVERHVTACRKEINEIKRRMGLPTEA
jgi:hypothetical protein